MDQEKVNIAYAELLNRCWDDPAYLAKFKADPAAALEDFGIPTVPGATYHIVAESEMKPSTAEDVYLPYQDKPGLNMLDDDAFDAVAGGLNSKTPSGLISPYANTTLVATTESVTMLLE